MRAASHLLADTPEGEMPLMPLPVEAAAAAAAAAGAPDPALLLSHEILGLSGLPLNPATSALASPR